MNRLLGIVWFCVFLVPCAYGETITYDDGSSYVGDVSNGVPHGQGTYTFANGDKYVGKFDSLSFHGQGSYFYASGNKYVAEWKDDKQNGQGTFTWANGDEYVGEFKEGNRHGQGTLTWANGEQYVGEWKDGKQLQGVEFGTPWADLSETKRENATACWNQDYADGAGEGNGWVVGISVDDGDYCKGWPDLCDHYAGSPRYATDSLFTEAFRNLILCK